MFSRYRSSIADKGSRSLRADPLQYLARLISMAPATTTDLELAARVRLAVTRLARRLRQQSGQGLSPSQISALASIEHRGPLTPSELAAIERIQRPSATRILGGL